MSSEAYKELKASVKILRLHLLSKKFRTDGYYRDRVFTGVISFRVLSHAAIEEYLEKRAIQIAVSASAICKKHGRISHSAACLVSFSKKIFGEPPDTFDSPQPNQQKIWQEKIDMKTRVSVAASLYISNIKNENHGIREKNVLNILLPIGFPTEKIDPLMLAEFDTFGKRRGEVAHSSPKVHTVKKPDPEQELATVNRIINLLKDVDDELDSILASVT
ncbi:HEPN domain-containing protein [Acuticoccus yangtzensis]|uniref:HEPN domain-containing protein n=1 Tax=Acuticoccus yangtzensis TaxID=1443441 RepID=UPI000AD833C4|nr:HEPN domain-containing protein [Acuticoccus yangtzensis]